MEEKIKLFNNITYKEWQKIKLVIDNKFYETSQKNTLDVDENVLKEFKIIFR